MIEDLYIHTCSWKRASGSVSPEHGEYDTAYSYVSQNVDCRFNDDLYDPRKEGVDTSGEKVVSRGTLFIDADVDIREGDILYKIPDDGYERHVEEADDAGGQGHHLQVRYKKIRYV